MVASGVGLSRAAVRWTVVLCWTDRREEDKSLGAREVRLKDNVRRNSRQKREGRAGWRGCDWFFISVG
jgi:hypothetical protein